VCAEYTHDIRWGNTGLFAVLEVATGEITADARHPHHTNVEFLALLPERLRSAGLLKDRANGFCPGSRAQAHIAKSRRGIGHNY
jgi:hypothetical protein